MKFRALFAAAAFCAIPQLASAEKCTQEQAFKKMQAFQLYITENLHGPKQRDVGFMAGEVAEVGSTLAEKKYDDACAEYERIAKKYAVDLPAFQARLVDPNKVGKGGCSVVTASTRITTMTQKLDSQMKAKQLDDVARSKTHEAFAKELQPIYPLVQTKPDDACAKLDVVAKKYGL